MAKVQTNFLLITVIFVIGVVSVSATGVPVTGTAIKVGEKKGTFEGVYTIAEMRLGDASNGKQHVETVGTLVGTAVVDGQSYAISEEVMGILTTRPGGQGRRLFGGGAACQILNLDLGPLDLNLLGLRIQLNRVILDITAIPGGGLLGDLLCAISNLLNGGLSNLLSSLILGQIIQNLLAAVNELLSGLALG